MSILFFLRSSFTRFKISVLQPAAEFVIFTQPDDSLLQSEYKQYLRISPDGYRRQTFFDLPQRSPADACAFTDLFGGEFSPQTSQANIFSQFRQQFTEPGYRSKGSCFHNVRYNDCLLY